MLLMETTMLARPALFLAAALFATTAARAETLTPVSTDVAYGDLNLSHADDAKVLATRLAAAAREVCLTANPDLAGKPEMKECTDTAINLAMAQLVNRLDQSVRMHLASDTITP